MDIQLLLRQIEQAGACIALLNKPTAEALQESIQENLPKGMEIEDLKVSYAGVVDGKLTLTTTLVIALPTAETPARRPHRATNKAAQQVTPAAPASPTPPPPPPQE